MVIIVSVLVIVLSYYLLHLAVQGAGHPAGGARHQGPIISHHISSYHIILVYIKTYHVMLYYIILYYQVPHAERAVVVPARGLHGALEHLAAEGAEEVLWYAGGELVDVTLRSAHSGAGAAAVRVAALWALLQVHAPEVQGGVDPLQAGGAALRHRDLCRWAPGRTPPRRADA